MSKRFKEHFSNIFIGRPPIKKEVELGTENPDFEPSSTTITNDEVVLIGNSFKIKKFEFSSKTCPANILEILNIKNESHEVVSSYKLISDDAFNYLDDNGLEILSSNRDDESIVIFVSSENRQKCSIYWKSSEVKDFLTLKHCKEENKEDDEIFYGFIANFLADALSKGELGINTQQLNLQNHTEIDIQNLIDHRGYNLLLLSAESGNFEVVQAFLAIGIDTEANNGVKAQDLAWKNRHSDVLLEFAKANLPYPDGIDLDELSDDFRGFYMETEALHDAIISKNIDKIEKILCSNQGTKLKYYYDLSNQSAAWVAIDIKVFDIYETLLINEIFLAPHEYEQGVFDDLDFKDQRQIRELHHKHSIELPNKHINILMAHSSIAHDVPDAVGKLKHIKEAYRTLSYHPKLNTILKTVVASKKFQIIFDFNRDAVNIADPTAPGNAEGNFYLFGRIYIGARQLLDPKTRQLVVSVLAHELCHCAVHLTYSNKANPYRKNDTLAAVKFEEINRKCQKEIGKEEVVDVVHKFYPEEVHHAELIVRPAHLTALYLEEPEKLQEVEQTFPDLFEYFDGVINDMEAAIPNIERHDEHLIKKNEQKITKLRKKLAFGGVLSGIGIIAVAAIVFYIFWKPTYKFEELSASNKARVRDGLVSYKGIDVKFSDLFPDNSTVYSKLNSDQITKIFNGQAMNFSDPKLTYFHDFLYLDWKNLTGKLKIKLLNSDFNFQNEVVGFKSLNPIVFDALTSEQIVNILDGKYLQIGKMLKNATKFYMERKFVFEGQSYYLVPSNFSNVHESMDVVIYRTELNKFFVLSSEAGAGKTVTFEQLTLRIKKKFPQKWVNYVDLKVHAGLYGTNETPLDLVEKILELSSQNEFELKVFRSLYESGQVVILWNGFDEISPTYSDFIVDLLTQIRETSRNVQYICTRPLYSDRLKTDFRIFPYELVPFTHNEQRQFLSGIISSENGNSSAIDLDRIQNISTRLNFNTPLMLILIANIRHDSKLVESENLYQMYKIFINSKLKIWQNSSEFIKNYSQFSLETGFNFDVRKMYQKFALLTIFSSQLQTKKLEIMKIEIPEQLPYEEISRMGIIYINTEDEFEFTHRTFAEYFVAQFFIENFYWAKLDAKFDENLLILFDKLKFEPQISKFLMDFVDTKPQGSQTSFNLEATKLLRTNYKDFFIFGLKTQSTDIFEMYFKFFQKDRQLFLDLMKINEPETLYTASFNMMYGPRHIDCEQLREISHKFLNAKEYAKFINGRNQKGRILYGIADSKLYNKDKIHYKLTVDVAVQEPYLLNIFDNLQPNLTKPEQIELLKFLLSHTNWFIGLSSFESVHYKNLWNNHVHMLSKNDTRLVIATAINGFSQIGYYLNSRKHATLLDFLYQKIDQIVPYSEVFEMFGKEKTLHKSTFFSSIFQKNWNFFVNHTDWNQQRKILQTKETFGQVWHASQEGKISFDLDSTSFNIFHFSLFNSIKTGGSFIFVRDLYERYFNATEIQELILESNDFMVPMTAFADPDTCFQFSNFLRKIFIGNEGELREFLLRNFEPTNFIIFDYFNGLSGFPDIKVDIFLTLLSKISEKRPVEPMELVPTDLMDVEVGVF